MGPSTVTKCKIRRNGGVWFRPTQRRRQRLREAEEIMLSHLRAEPAESAGTHQSHRLQQGQKPQCLCGTFTENWLDENR